MNDWKDALSALTGIERPEATSDNANNQATVERKKRVGVVYSTNPDYTYSDNTADEATTLPPRQQKLRVSMERAGRGGKTVSLVRGFVGSDDGLQALAKRLKQRCGVGGTAKDGEIVIQGDHCSRLVEILKAEGYTQTK